MNQWPSLARPGRLRDLVRGMCIDWGVSIRKVCGAICFDTSSDHYRSRRRDQAAVERRIKEIAETRVAMVAGASTCFCGARAGLST